MCYLLVTWQEWNKRKSAMAAEASSSAAALPMTSSSAPSPNLYPGSAAVASGPVPGQGPSQVQ